MQILCKKQIVAFINKSKMQNMKNKYQKQNVKLININLN